MINYECSICHNGNIKENDCYDIDHGQTEIIEYYSGHCRACGKNFRWERHYKFAYQTPYEEELTLLALFNSARRRVRMY